MIEKFTKWLQNVYVKKDKKKLSERSVKKYIGAIKKLNLFALEKNISKKDLTQLSICELEVARDKIFKDKDFIRFNTIGNDMYGRGLKLYVSFRILQANSAIEEFENDLIEIENDTNLSKTEKIIYKKARIGQGQYRDQLLKIFNYECFVTGINIQETLIASHIKPWCICKNYEKIDKNNGLILSATIDRLFDSGLITFLGNGQIILSSFVTNEQAKRIGIRNNQKFNVIFNNKQKDYLKYHNKNKFIDNLNEL